MAALTKEELAEQQWQEFVEIGNTIQNMRGVERTLMGRSAIKFAEGFIDSEVHMKTMDRFRLFKQLVPKIAEYIDGDAETMKIAVKQHLKTLYYKDGLPDEEWNGVKWFNKKSGVQNGFSCVVYHGITSRQTRYFVKTHQHGPISGSEKGTRCPNLKEVFIYKLLQHIGIGPEAHFVFPFNGSRLALYIMTKGVELLLLSELPPKAVNKTALLQIYLISRILCLRDCGTNPSNCGQVGDKPMIVDFRIETQSDGYSNPDILEKFYGGNSEFNYLEPMNSAVVESKDEKLRVVKESLLEWNLLANIDKAIVVLDAVKRLATDEKVKFEDDLAKYVEGIKKTIEVLGSCLTQPDSQ